MNQIRRTDKLTDEISRMREVVHSQKLPDFVTAFDIDAGEFQGDPVVWITFHLTGTDDVPLEELQARSKILVPLEQKLTSALRDQATDRFPFFKYDYDGTASLR